MNPTKHGQRGEESAKARGTQEPQTATPPHPAPSIAPSEGAANGIAATSFPEVTSPILDGHPELLAWLQGTDLKDLSRIGQELSGTMSDAVIPILLARITQAIASAQHILLHDTVEICIAAKVQVRAVPRAGDAVEASDSKVPEPEEPVFLECFPEAFRKKVMKLLKGIFVLGCACKRGATSLGEAEDWLKKRDCPIPYVKSKLSAYLRSTSWEDTAPTLFIEFLKDGKEKLYLREEGPEPPCDSMGRPLHTDSRRIIGLSEAGWRLWTAAGEFLRKHDRTFWTYASLLPE